jgi:site-specific DNA recombinase
VDPILFFDVRSKMANNAPEEIHPRVVPSFYLLSGLLFCSCGRAMIGRSAKSHRYYYYSCNRSYKQGKDQCDNKILPKDKLEHVVIDQIKRKILDGDYLQELVNLVDSELDSGHSSLTEKLVNLDTQLDEVGIRLS